MADEKSISSEENSENHGILSYDQFLAETNSTAVKPEAFFHIAQAYKDIIEAGMMLEYVWKNNMQQNPPSRSYWYIKVLLSAAPLLFAKFADEDDVSGALIIIDLDNDKNVFPMGYFKMKNHEPETKVYGVPEVPPGLRFERQAEEVMQIIEDRNSYTVPMEFLRDYGGRPFVERIQAGSVMEILSQEDPHCAWPVTITECVGGRLKIRYWPLTERHSEEDSWVYCTLTLIQELGTTGRFKIPPDTSIRTSLDSNWKVQIREMVERKYQGLMKTPPVELFTTNSINPNHGFQVGVQVEMVNPDGEKAIVPGLVTKVYEKGYFSCNVADLNEKDTKSDASLSKIVSYYGDMRVLPPFWCEKNGVKLAKPGGWKSSKHGEVHWQNMKDAGIGQNLPNPKSFNWLNKLLNSNAMSFKAGQKLEAVNPDEPAEICVATIVRVLPPLLWIHIDSYGRSLTYIVPFDSSDIFPCGFSAMHNKKLCLPRSMHHGRRDSTIRSRCSSSVSDLNNTNGTSPKRLSRSFSKSSFNGAENNSKQLATVTPIAGNIRKANNKARRIGDAKPTPVEKSGCVTLFLSRNCTYGPNVSPKKISTLPRRIGPGPVSYVLQNFVTVLSKACRSQAQILKWLQSMTYSSMENEPGIMGKKPRGMVQMKIKNHYSKTRHGLSWIWIPTESYQVDAFVRQICTVIECCPLLYTTAKRGDSFQCEENCEQWIKPNTKAPMGKRVFGNLRAVKHESSPKKLSLRAKKENDADSNTTIIQTSSRLTRSTAQSQSTSTNKRGKSPQKRRAYSPTFVPKNRKRAKKEKAPSEAASVSGASQLSDKTPESTSEKRAVKSEKTVLVDEALSICPVKIHSSPFTMDVVKRVPLAKDPNFQAINERVKADSGTGDVKYALSGDAVLNADAWSKFLLLSGDLSLSKKHIDMVRASDPRTWTVEDVSFVFKNVGGCFSEKVVLHEIAGMQLMMMDKFMLEAIGICGPYNAMVLREITKFKSALIYVYAHTFDQNEWNTLVGLPAEFSCA